MGQKMRHHWRRYGRRILYWRRRYVYQVRKDMLKHIEEEGFDSIDEAYECDYYYWTEWECPEDIQYMEIDGKMYEEGEPEFEKHFTHA